MPFVLNIKNEHIMGKFWGFHGGHVSSRGLLSGAIWSWRKHGPQKRWYPTTTLHGVITQKTSTRNIMEKTFLSVSMVIFLTIQRISIKFGIRILQLLKFCQIYHCFIPFRPPLGPTHPVIQWVPGATSAKVKRTGREADHFTHLHIVPRLVIRLHGVLLS
jgi:hypothetical protein